MATTPTRAAATTHRADAGNSRWGKPSTLVHPMLVVYAWPVANGTSQNAVSPTPMAPATTPQARRRDPPSAGQPAPHAPVQPAGQVGVEEQPDPGPHRGEDGRDQVAEEGDGEQDGGQGPVATGPQARGHDAEEEQGDREAERVGELAGQGGQDVPPVDGEAGLEEERAGWPRRGTPGPGSRRPARRPNAHAQTGRVSVPSTVTSLKATL